MPTPVQIPGVGLVNFPDGMSPDDINVASKKLYDDKAAELKTANTALAARAATVTEDEKNTPSTYLGRLAKSYAPGQMLSDAWEGAKGEVEGLAGGLVGAASLPVALAVAARHPVDTGHALVTAGKGALALGNDIVQDPRKAGDVALKLAADPGNIGRAAGMVDAGLLAGKVTKSVNGAIGGSPLGVAVKAGASAAADRIPGVAVARKVYATAKAGQAGKTAELADELGLERNAVATKLEDLPNVGIPDRGGSPTSIPRFGEGVETSDLPLYRQQALLEQAGGPAATDATASRVPSPSHPQVGVGARGAEQQGPEAVASSYAKKNGFPEPAAHTPVKINEDFSKSVADAYDAMQHNPNDPATKAAYSALSKEISQQFEHITTEGGLKVTPWTAEGQPYASSKAMADDIRTNNHLYYFPTESGFGTAASVDNPLLAAGKSGLPVNDELRIVHDYLAHAKGGFSFGPQGEENAFLEHLKLLSPDAGRALATETRGQNSWVNFGKHLRDGEGNLFKPGQAGFVAPPDRPFAAQKTGLLPDELLPPSLRAAAKTAKTAAKAAAKKTREELAAELAKRLGTPGSK